MGTFPFVLSIKRSSSNPETESLLCKEHLRFVPRGRDVYDAEWKDRSVVVKVFSKRLRAAHRFRKEWQGLQQLRSRDIDTPEPLFCGKTEDGRFAVVVEKILDSPTMLDAFDAATEKSTQVDLLIRVCRELAREHEKGIMQQDLHLDNFLLDGERLLVLDPGQMRFFDGPLARKMSISQLALLVRYMPAEDGESISRICAEYFKARRWRFEKPDQVTFQKEIKLHTRQTIRKSLRKCLRTNKRHLRIRTSGFRALIDRSFCDGVDPRDFVEQIDELMAKGEILKDGNTCYMSRFTWNGSDIVVKKYKHKGLVHSFRHTIKRSRARQGWLHGYRLGVLEIATPKPVVYIERLKGPLVWKSYLITEYVEGQKLYYFLRDDSIDNEQRAATMHRILEMVDKLREYRITHGDLKPSNILIADDGPVLTDLDSMKVHKSSLACRRRWAKDRTGLEELVRQFVRAARP